MHRIIISDTSTLILFHKAKQMSIIKEIKPLIDKLLETDFRISDIIINELLALNGETNYLYISNTELK